MLKNDPVRTCKEPTAKCEIKSNHLEISASNLVILQVALPTDIQRKIKGYSKVRCV